MKTTRNLKLFIGLVVLATIIFGAANDLSPRLPAGIQGVVQFSLVVLFFWVVFDFISQVIYRMAGITRKLGRKNMPKRLTHQQADVVNTYWTAWLATVLMTGTVYVLVFNRHSWKSSIATGIALALMILASVLRHRQTIMGHTKEEIFK